MKRRRIHTLLRLFPVSLLAAFVIGCDSRTEEASRSSSAEKPDEPTQVSSAPVLHSVVFQKIFLPAESRGRTRNQSQALAARIRTQIEDGEDFGLLARNHSEDAFAADGGVVDVLPEDLEEGPFRSFVEAGEEGEVSSVIEFPDGFVIAQLLKRRYKPIPMSEAIALIDRRTKQEAEQAGAGQPATRPESKSEGGDKPQPEPEGRSR